MSDIDICIERQSNLATPDLHWMVDRCWVVAVVILYSREHADPGQSWNWKFKFSRPVKSRKISHM